MGSKVTAASKERGLGASASAQSLLAVMLKIVRERENAPRLLFKCVVFLHLERGVQFQFVELKNDRAELGKVQSEAIRIISSTELLSIRAA